LKIFDPVRISITPNPMKVIGMTAKDHVPRVTALATVVFIMQRLVQVADEMNHEFEGLCLSVFVGVRVFQDGEELLRLGDHATTVRALAGEVDLGIPDVDVVPRAGPGGAGVRVGGSGFRGRCKGRRG
jgi:hypothetical protein